MSGAWKYELNKIIQINSVDIDSDGYCCKLLLQIVF